MSQSYGNNWPLYGQLQLLPRPRRLSINFLCSKNEETREMVGKRKEYSEVRMTVNLLNMHESRIIDKKWTEGVITYVFSTHF
jgi:hypothetical protein